MTQVSELKIKWEWEPGESVRAPEHAATWARIEIWVGSDCITLVEDVEFGSSRRSIYCPLYPLAEWVAYNWWTLQADGRPAGEIGLRTSGMTINRQKVSPRLRRHSVRASGDGFLWPDLLIVPEGEQMRLAWRREMVSPSADRRVRFLTEGDALASRDTLMRELARMVSEVLGRLAERGVYDTPLHEEWRAIRHAKPDEVDFCLAAARLGLDPYAEAEPYEGAIMRASERLSGNLLNDFFDAVDPEKIDVALAWIDTAAAAIHGQRNHAREDAVRDLRGELRNKRGPRVHLPWENGWRQAEIVRDILEVDSVRPFDLDRLVFNMQRTLDDRGVLAAGDSIERSSPAVVTAQSGTAEARRFTLGRALWHYLWGEENDLFLVTTSYTDRQKVERAFAAELLAPARGIAQVAGASPESVSAEDIERVAAHFEVSPMVVQHQVRNQLLAA